MSNNNGFIVVVYYIREMNSSKINKLRVIVYKTGASPIYGVAPGYLPGGNIR